MCEISLPSGQSERILVPTPTPNDKQPISWTAASLHETFYRPRSKAN